MEKHLLISLSQVYSEIKEYESDSSSDMEGNSAGEGQVVPGSHSDNHHCLTKVIGALMVMVARENPYIQHLIGNILVAVSDFLVESGSCWGEYINLLYLCVNISIFNGLSSMGHPMEIKDLKWNSSPSPLPKLNLEIGSWSTAAVIMKVLHNVLKQLNRDLNDPIFNMYLDSTTCFISNMPWDLLSEVCLAQRDSSSGCFLHVKVAKPGPILMFQGYLLRLLCSLIKFDWTEDVVGASIEDSLIFEIKNLLPRLLASCLHNSQSSDNVAISHYLKHKILILMIRLSNQIHLGHSIVVSWLDLIHTYFRDLLLQSMDGQEFGPDNYLKGSPFGAVTFDMGKKEISSKHLQRLAIFLFLRCSFRLLDMKETADQHFLYRRKAILELHEWLRELLPDDIFNDDVCSEQGMDFASSFLHLYMEEDDMLFEMLLQMFSLPFCSEQKFTEEWAFSADEARKFSLVSHLFQPIHFFHLFLTGIHYDHQVLLDCLISKDTGASSAEYLLRCLRKVCDSWSIFVGFSWSRKSQSRKRRKFLTDDYSSEAVPHESKSKNTYGCQDEDYISQRSPFECARNCLFTLKTSVESLHQKNLFPYNPQVLLRRLTRFQELCGSG